MSRTFVLCALALTACPSNSPSDGGAGGGAVSTGGGTGGGTAATGGGATGGGAATGGGSATGGGAGGGLAGIPFAQFCAVGVQAQCQLAISCGKALQSELADCIAQLRPQCEWQMDHARNSSTLPYDPVHAAACVAGFAAKNCGTYYGAWPLPVCYGLGITQTPSFDAGAGCSVSQTYGATCDYGQNYCALAPFTACGVCTAYPQPGVQLGGLCDDFGAQRCATTLFCAYQGDGGAARCETKHADGDPPNGNASCNNGVISVAGDGGLICGLVPAGQPCGPNSQCVSTHYCMGVTASPPGNGVCTVRTPLGQSCINRQVDDGCVGGTCLGGVCVATSGINFNAVDAGGECEFYVGCRSEERCVFDGGTRPIREGRCGPRVAVGQPCTDVQDCVTSAYCYGGTCRALGADGEACYSGTGSPCRMPYQCMPVSDGGYQCTAYPTLGQPCTYFCMNPDAGRAVCAHADGGNAGFCSEPLANGAPCDDDRQCAGFVCTSLDGGGDKTCQSGCWP